MGISSALNIAAGGLRANTLQSDLVARNISNAQTEGYSRKSADLITRNGSVVVAGVSREVDSLLDRLDRTNRSEVARSRTEAEGLTTYTDLLGQPNDETSPAAGLNRVYTSLVTLVGAPGTPAAQEGVVEAAKSLARQVSDLGSTLNELDQEVGLNIRYDVSDVNDRLTRIGQINTRLLQTMPGGIGAAELQDELGRLLDEVSSYMDIHVTAYSDGAMNVYTSGGSELVQGGRVTSLTYDAVAGRLFAGKSEITPGKAGVHGFEAGSLAGLFNLKDRAIPQIRAGLDTFTVALIERFAAADSSLAPGEDGLFTDSAKGSIGITSQSISARLIINPKLDPTAGGNAAHLVTGLGSGQTLAAGSVAIINALLDGIDARDAGGLSLNDQASNMVAGQQQMRVAAERSVQAAEISGATISASRQNLQGVNIDDELQVLLVIEQSFAANAKVLTSLQLMLDALMESV